jgi:hypothetical protein
MKKDSILYLLQKLGYSNIFIFHSDLERDKEYIEFESIPHKKVLLDE